jgi:hypothetical protein
LVSVISRVPAFLGPVVTLEAFTLAGLSGAFAFVGLAFAFVGEAFAFVGHAVTAVCRRLAPVGATFALRELVLASRQFAVAIVRNVTRAFAVGPDHEASVSRSPWQRGASAAR